MKKNPETLSAPTSSTMMFVSLQMAQNPCCFFPLQHKGLLLHSLILLDAYFLLLSCNENKFYIRRLCSVQVIRDPQNPQL